jgi:hypothetical protein
MLKKVLRLQKVEGGVVVYVDGLVELLGDMASYFTKEGDGLDKELKKNWHWSEEEKGRKMLELGVLFGRVAELVALNTWLVDAEGDEVKPG